MTSPATLACRPQRWKISITSASRPFCTTSSIRSWDSESKYSQAAMPLSRAGTRSRSKRIPTPPLAAISAVEQVIPAAPMSWAATTAPVAKASRQASMRHLPRKGSPTCTAGRSCCASSLSSALAKLAPRIPSRPVVAPTYKIGLPTPRAADFTTAGVSSRPRAMTLTRGLPL